VGRKNLPITAGLRASATVFALFIGCTYAVIIASVILGQMPLLSLIGLATVIFSVPSIIGAFKYNGDIPKLIPAMGQNVIINLVTPLLLAIGIFCGK